jgi:hypothetical protein
VILIRAFSLDEGVMAFGLSKEGYVVFVLRIDNIPF